MGNTILSDHTILKCIANAEWLNACVWVCAEVLPLVSKLAKVFLMINGMQ